MNQIEAATNISFKKFLTGRWDFRKVIEHIGPNTAKYQDLRAWKELAESHIQAGWISKRDGCGEALSEGIKLVTKLSSGAGILHLSRIATPPLDKKFKIEFKDGESLELPIYYREVLAIDSNYFRILFTSGYKEAYTDPKFVELSKEDFLLMLTASYGALTDIDDEKALLCTLTEKSAEKLYRLNTLYEFRPLLEYCKPFFKEYISSLGFNNEQALSEVKSVLLHFPCYRPWIEKHVSQLLLDLSKKVDEVLINRKRTKSLFPTPILEVEMPSEEEKLYNATFKAIEGIGLKKITLSRLPDARLDLVCPRVSSLALGRFMFDNYKSVCNITDSRFAELTMPLTSLALYDCDKLTDKVLLEIKKIKTLSSLICCRINISDEGLVNLDEMPQLHSFALTCENITDKGISTIGKWRNLTFLSIGCWQMTDEGLATLQELKIKYLTIRGSEYITNVGLNTYTKKMPLVALNIEIPKGRNCHPQLTGRGICDFAKERPNVLLQHNVYP